MLLEMQYAILLICYVSSFVSLGKVLLLEDENTDGCRPRIIMYIYLIKLLREALFPSGSKKSDTS